MLFERNIKILWDQDAFCIDIYQNIKADMGVPKMYPLCSMNTSGKLISDSYKMHGKATYAANIITKLLLLLHLGLPGPMVQEMS